MNGLEVVVKVDTRVMDRMSETLRGRLRAVVAKAAFDVEAEGKDKSPIKTGANKASIYTTLSQGADTYSGAAVEARRLRPGLPLHPRRSVDPDVIEASVGPSTFYGILLEYGTVGMAARPYMTPALEQTRAPFLAAIQAVLQEAARG